MQQWSSSGSKMGQYTGNVTLTPIAAKEQTAGIQAWVKRDMFQNLKPVGDGFGAKMLRKLGWKDGEPLGKSGIGCVEPVADEVKLDRKCENTHRYHRTVAGVGLVLLFTVCCCDSIEGTLYFYIVSHGILFLSAGGSHVDDLLCYGR